jgi:hypothetical protein
MEDTHITNFSSSIPQQNLFDFAFGRADSPDIGTSLGLFTVDSNGSLRGRLKNRLRNLGVCGGVRIGTETEFKRFQL